MRGTIQLTNIAGFGVGQEILIHGEIYLVNSINWNTLEIEIESQSEAQIYSGEKIRTKDGSVYQIQAAHLDHGSTNPISKPPRTDQEADLEKVLEPTMRRLDAFWTLP